VAASSHSDGGCREVGATKQSTTLETKSHVKEKKLSKEMGNGKHIVPVTRSTSIVSLSKIKKNNIYFYIYEIYTNFSYNRYKSLFQYYKNAIALIFIPVESIIGIKNLILFTKFLSASYFIPDGFEQV